MCFSTGQNQMWTRSTRIFKQMINKLVVITLSLLTVTELPLYAQSLEAPPGMFKDLNDQVIGKSLIIHGKQLFIDDYIISQLDGVKKTLNKPVKHQSNPLIVPDKPWEG